MSLTIPHAATATKPLLAAYLTACGVRVPPAAKRRWRRHRARQAREGWTNDTPALAPALDTGWEDNRNSGHTTSPIGLGALHASFLLDVFARVKPADDALLTGVQKDLVTKALAEVLDITQQMRVLTMRAEEPLVRLRIPDDPEMCVHLRCTVCYASVCEIVLLLCGHVVLCEVRGAGQEFGEMGLADACRRVPIIYIIASRWESGCGVRFVGWRRARGYFPRMRSS